ncbi:MAG: metallophosphoesterase [Candidatus Heimdallarchaeota archaeon]|nr:metallophosphoesterase [Candidatus Heimdallarchaeota archaeon]MCK4954950.1 metallophosphoesterase [Candidatus Heimdallarchaeota archaeon]
MIKRIPTYIILLSFILSSFLPLAQGRNWKVNAEQETESWHFIALGDSRNWYVNSTNIFRKNIYEYIVNKDPNFEFILHTGDIVYQGGDQLSWDRYYEDIDLAVQNDVKFYYAVGNHEMYTRNYTDGSYGPLDMDFSTYMANVVQPGNERYYSFDYKDRIHFIIINTDEYWTNAEFNITSDQEQWIIDDLSSNTLDFTIAMFHRPMYSIRSNSRVNNAKEIREVLEPILQEYGVDLVFSGHDHQYYRTLRKGILNIITSGAGAPLYSQDATGYALDGDLYFSDYHYCNITISEEQVLLEIMRFDESIETVTLADTVTIESDGTILYGPQESSVYFSIIPLAFLIVTLVYIGIVKRRKKI